MEGQVASGGKGGDGPVQGGFFRPGPPPVMSGVSGNVVSWLLVCLLTASAVEFRFPGERPSRVAPTPVVNNGSVLSGEGEDRRDVAFLDNEILAPANRSSASDAAVLVKVLASKMKNHHLVDHHGHGAHDDPRGFQNSIVEMLGKSKYKFIGTYRQEFASIRPIYRVREISNIN